MALFNCRTISLLVITTFCLIHFLIAFIQRMGKDTWYKFFLLLTMMNLTLESLYLSIVCICEIFHFETKPIYELFVNKIGKYVFSISLNVFFTYWSFTMMGEDVIHWSDSAVKIYFSIILHFVIECFIVIEIITNPNRKHIKGLFKRDLIILLLVMISYSIVLVIEAKNTDIYAYNFLQKDYINIVGYFSSSVLFLVLSYLI